MALILVLFLVAGVILGAVIYTATKSIMLDSLGEMSTAYNLLVQKDLEILKKTLEGISEIAVSYDLPLNDVKVNEELDKIKGDYGFTTIFGLDSQGNTHLPGVTAGDREYFKESMKGNFYATSPFLKSDNTVGITVSVPAYRNGEIVGIVSCGLPYDYFGSFIDFNIGETGEAYIIDKNGLMVAHKESDWVLNLHNPIEMAKENKELKSQAAVLQKFLDGDLSVQNYTSSTGVRRTVIGTKIAGTDGWILVTGLNNSEINGVSVITLVILGAIIAVGLIIGVLVAFRIAGKISKPLIATSERVSLLSDGELGKEVEVFSTGDEIQILSESLSNTVKNLNRYIKQIGEVAGEMADYNLCVKIEDDYAGDFIAIKESLNSLISVLNECFANIFETAEQVSSGAHQVLTGAQALSEGTSDQSSAVEELLAMISEISNQVNENARNTASAAAIANTSSNNMQLSREQMQEMIQAMNEISDSSSKIENIINTIEDIASQTNLLSLNASIEAARAGEAGRGFAVVANEVSSLAAQSAQASKNTFTLIQNSLEAVQKGIRIADMAEKSLEEAEAGSKELEINISKISSATSEQANSLSQINAGIEQITNVVMSNASLADASANSSEELSRQSVILKDLVGQFRIEKRKN